MSREPEAIVAQRRQLGAALATFRKAGALTQVQVGRDTGYDRTSINKIERGHQLPDRPFWRAVDRLLQAEGALVKHYDDLVANKRIYAEGQRRSSRAHHQVDARRLRRAGQPMVPASLCAAENEFAVSTAPALSLPITCYADTRFTLKQSSSTSGTLSSWTIVLVAVTWPAWPCGSSARCISSLARVPTNRLLNVIRRQQ